MSDLKVTVMAFEEPYSDDSGVEFRVKYDSNDTDDEITFERVSNTSFPAKKLDWLIASLVRIRAEIETKESID